MASTLTRPREGRIIAGVCAGLARRFGWSVFVVRLLFLLSLVLPGSQVIVYLMLWILMPNERQLLSRSTPGLDRLTHGLARCRP